MDTGLNDLTTGRDDALYPRAAEPASAPQPTSRGMQLVQWVMGGIGGFALVAGLDAFADDVSFPLLAAMLALAIAMLWLQVLVHEAGHAVAGVLVGRRLVAAGIGPLRLERGVGGWMVRWGGNVRGLSGFAVLLPPDRATQSRRDVATFILGGPLANLLCAAVALLVLALAPPLGVTASVALAGTVFGGGLLGLINLVPWQNQGWHTDGYNLRELWRDTPAWRMSCAQACVVAMSMAGVRPRDWPADQLTVPDGVPTQMAATMHVLRMGHALDRDDHAAAGAAARALADAYPGAADGSRQGIAATLASYAARTRDADLLAAWRPLCEGGLLDLAPYRLWLDAEAAALAGDAVAARAVSARAREAMPRIHDRAGVLVMEEYLDELDTRLAEAG